MGVIRIGIVLALMVATGVTGCSRGANCSPSSSSRVAIPSAADPPAKTVTAYFAAIDAHDVRAARALMTPAFADRTSAQVCEWTLRNAKIDFVSDDQDPAGRYGHVVHATVSFDLSQADETPDMPNGHVDWGYWLGRNKPTERWLIFESGIG